MQKDKNCLSVDHHNEDVDENETHHPCRRLASATAASVNAFVTETANGVATIRTYKTQQVS